MSVEFADVAYPQGSIDWSRYRKGESRLSRGHPLAYPRVQDGDILDRYWGKQRCEEMVLARVLDFPYIFGRVGAPSNGHRTPAKEVDMALVRMRKAGWGLHPAYQGPMVYDFETSNGMGYTAAGLHYLGALEAYHDIEGHPFWTYTMPGFWMPVWNAISNRISAKQRALVASSPLIVASWGVSQAPHIGPFAELVGHQFTNHTRYAGIGAYSDGNRLLVSVRHLRRRHTLHALGK